MYKAPQDFLNADAAAGRVMAHARLLMKLDRRFDAWDRQPAPPRKPRTSPFTHFSTRLPTLVHQPVHVNREIKHETRTSCRNVADAAAYINSLCIPLEHGKYEGADAATQVAKGKDLYEKQCLECHGKNGEGNKEKFYPVIAGQHYKYLLRQMTEIRDGHRRNANPDMVKVIKPYTNDQLVAISAYQASLVMPGNMCKPKAGKKK